MPVDYIDTSVFLGQIFEEDRACKDYLNTVGYKNNNSGKISHFILSEIFANILLKIEDDDKDKRYFLQTKAYEHALDILNDLIDEEKAALIKLKERIDFDLLKDLMRENYALSYDDALHLCLAISHDCEFFSTIDKEIIENKNFQEYLTREHNLKIKALI